jgi:hypothetical protein
MLNRVVPATAEGLPVRRSRRKPKPKVGIAALSFVANRDGKDLPMATAGQMPRCFWNVKHTEDMDEAGRLGARLALEYLTYEAWAVQQSVHLPVLAHIVGDMPRPLSQIEITFLQLIGHGVHKTLPYATAVAVHWHGREVLPKPANDADRQIEGRA